MRCVKSLFGFFTIIPTGGAEVFMCTWALPYVVAPAVAAPAAVLLHLGVSPYVAYAVLLLMTGLHHLDGLADVADALMVKDRERARIVLEDPRKGVAGVFAVVTTFFIASFSLRSPLQLITAEVFSKSITVALTAFSKPFKSGYGEAFIQSTKGKWFLALPALITTLWLYPTAFLALFLTLAFFYAAYRHLGGANGDVFGYVLELSRVFFLAVSF